jgi:hypothetical protein
LFSRNLLKASILAVIWLCSAQAGDGFWTPPENLGAPVNTQADELAAVLDDTGTKLYFARTVGGQNDLYMSTWEDTVWGRPTALTLLNSALYNETNPTLSRDGTRLYFVSDRSSGSGGFDIWVAAWNGTQWTDPVPLGPNVNTEQDEWYAAESEGGLYVSARLESGSNRGDILFAEGTYPDFEVRQPVPNMATPAREMSAFPSTDGALLLLTTDRSGSAGQDDIWRSEATDSGWTDPQPTSCNLNSADYDQYPTLSVDGLTLLYASYNRPVGVGNSDLYAARWRALGDINGDQRASSADIIYLVNYLFSGGPAPADPWTDDPNCDGKAGMVDVIILVNYVLRFGTEPCNQCEL